MTKFTIFRTWSVTIPTRSRANSISGASSSDMCLSPTTERRWSPSIFSRRPSASDINEIELPAGLEKRWAEAWDRAPISATETPSYLKRLLPKRPISAPAILGRA
jgi:hypothetical protein